MLPPLHEIVGSDRKSKGKRFILACLRETCFVGNIQNSKKTGKSGRQNQGNRLRQQQKRENARKQNYKLHSEQISTTKYFIKC